MSRRKEPSLFQGPGRPVTFEPSRARSVDPGQLGVRFAAGAVASLIAGIVALVFGARAGGVFLAFPAILAATLTLIAEEQRSFDAREDARGAALGSLALAAFAVAVVLLVERIPAALALTAAVLVWIVLAVTLYALAWRRSALKSRRQGARPAATGGGFPPGARGSAITRNERTEGTMFERLDNPQDLFNWRLGAALTMEREIVDMLDELIEESRNESVKEAFREHQAETRGHVQNLEQVFGIFGWDVDDSPCPTIKAIEKEGKANIKKSEESIVDSTILAGATETEHHEIAVYENLILHARAMGHEDAVSLLQRNLDEEKHALEKVISLAREQAEVGARVHAGQAREAA